MGWREAVTVLGSWLTMEGGVGRKLHWRVLGRAVGAGPGGE
ncbi:hypothetical protein [Kitasatospora purpeofusca]